MSDSTPDWVKVICAICDKDLGYRERDAFQVPFECGDCRTQYPAALRKAHCDPFDYAMGLRTGEVVRFTEAVITGEFVTVKLSDYHEPTEERLAIPFPCPRHVDVRITDIVWIADAPEGS